MEDGFRLCDGEGIHRWIEILMDEEGDCLLVLACHNPIENARHTFPCSLDNLRMVQNGLSYQATAAAGFVQLLRERTVLRVHFKRADERESWSCTVPIEEFEAKMERLADLATQRRHGLS